MKHAPDDTAPVRGRVDRDGRLIAADAALAALHARAGGTASGVVAVPQIAAVARLARRLGILVSRGVVAADGEHDVDLWIRAQPDGEAIDLAIGGWTRRPATLPVPAEPAEREHDFLRAAADWAWETDGALRLRPFAADAVAAIGGSAAELVGQPMTRLFALVEGPDGALPLLEALALGRSFEAQLAELRPQSGLRVSLAGLPLIDGNGRFGGFRGTTTQVAPEPSEPEGAADAGAFGERLDRALRLPLDRIITSAETIRSQNDGPLRRDYVEYAADIASAGRHLLALVDDLVDLQAIERPDFRPRRELLDLADIGRRAAGLLAVRASANGVTIDRPQLGEALPATGEFRRALQILVNLVANAVRYSPEGGMIWIRCERDRGFAAIIVADQGKGIAVADHARIFDKFERVDPAEPGGTGLGLYIARRLARAMGGDLIVDSAPGQGARFVLTLPGAEMG